MLNKVKNSYYKLGAAMTIGMMVSSVGEANAAAAAAAPGNNFGSIAENITNSIANLPGLISAISYLFGTLLAVLGIMKIKDHVENPTQTPLKEGAIRLAVGGALFSIPIVMEAMTNTMGTGNATSSATMQAVSFGIAP